MECLKFKRTFYYPTKGLFFPTSDKAHRGVTIHSQKVEEQCTSLKIKTDLVT